MKSYSIIASLAASIPFAHGHWYYARIAHNNVWQEPLRYIRNNTQPFMDRVAPPGYNLNFARDWFAPTFLGDFDESLRCGRDNMRHAPGTEVLKIRSGDEITIAMNWILPDSFTNQYPFDCQRGYGTCLPENHSMSLVPNHDGPIQTYLSKVPEGLNVTEYDGSGEWIKIWTLGVDKDAINRSQPNFWKDRPADWYDAPIWKMIIPKQTPAGQYLLRVEGVWANQAKNYTQFYPGCVHLDIQSNTTGSLPRGIKFPDNYYNDDTGVVVSLNMSSGGFIDPSYKYPGGPLWDGEKLIEPNI